MLIVNTIFDARSDKNIVKIQVLYRLFNISIATYPLVLFVKRKYTTNRLIFCTL